MNKINNINVNGTLYEIDTVLASAIEDGSTVLVLDSTEYRGENISSVTLQYPTENFECWLRLTFADSGSITVTIPESTYIGNVPTFANGETWEISIKDRVVVAQKVGDEI